MQRTTIRHAQFCFATITAMLIGGCYDNSPTGSVSGTPANTVAAPAEGVTTLYARDPLERTFCFRDGKYGGVIQQNEVRNRSSDIDFNNYVAGAFTVAVEGSKLGTIVDLGTADSLQSRYGYEETVGGGQGFASIRLQNRTLYILKDYNAKTLQLLAEGSRLYTDTLKSTASLPVGLEHIYLMRTVDPNDPGFELLVKMYVVSYQPGDYVTIRYQVL